MRSHLPILLGAVAGAGIFLGLLSAPHAVGQGADQSEVIIAPAGQGLKWNKKLLMLSLNEGSAVADVDKDGVLDVIAGRNWFPGPDYIPRPLRSIEEFGDYAHSNADLVHDVNGDGWPDVIASSFMNEGVYWYENPGKKNLQRGMLWMANLLKKTHGENEANFLRDIDGDGVPELVVNRWAANTPLTALKLAKGADGKVTLETKTLSPTGNAHGIGFGDINGDGREDVISSLGWWEKPAGDPLASEWKFHPDWKFGSASCPMIVVDLNGDGRPDIIRGEGHAYGLFWEEQIAPAADGKLRFKHHLIDKSFSQVHCLLWADLDGDGAPELITGKRVRAHPEGDPGVNDPSCLYYFKWDKATGRFTRYAIDEGNGVGTGLQINLADMNGDGRMDIVVSGKSGVWVLTNMGK